MTPWDDDAYAAFDFETSGILPEYALQPWRIPKGDAWATSVVSLWRKDQKIETSGCLFPSKKDIRLILEQALDEQRILLGWNTVFDIAILLAYGLDKLVFQCRFMDGMLLWRHLDIEPEYEATGPSRRSYSLKVAVPTFLPQHAGYEKDIDYHSDDPAELHDLHYYNKQDCLFTLRIAKMLWSKLKSKQQQAAIIEAQCLPMVAQANLRGMSIDRLAARGLAADLDKVAATKLKSLAPHGVSEKVVRSPVQMGKLLFDDWKLPVLKENKSKKTGKTTRSTDKETLHELAFKDPRAKELREYREALNCKTKFAVAPLASSLYNGDNQSHPQAIVFGTYSGRMTYASKQGKGVNTKQTGFALHQEKRGEEFRSLVVAPPGFTIVEFDAAGQEFRWMAIASGDPTMLGLCLPGEDPHSFMGARITHRDYRGLIKAVHDKKDPGNKQAKADRQMGKIANLCVAEDTRVLTDRGYVAIQNIQKGDRVWDGVEFVTHDGVSFSGVLPVMSHAGLTATPDHGVLVGGAWVSHQEAAEHGWRIEPALGAGWARQCRSAVRIVDGVVRRAVREVGRALRAGALRLWARAGRQSPVHGDWAFSAVQGLCDPSAASAGRRADCSDTRGQAASEARQCLVPTLRQSEGSLMAQLRRAWDRVSVRFSQAGRGLHQGDVAASDLSEAGHRPQKQRRSLRAGQPALGYAQGQPRQQVAPCYDIVNCGPRTRFATHAGIVHNSLQYRTSAKKLRSVARVQYLLPMELPEAQHIHATYLSTYTRVPQYWGTQITLTQSRGYVETFAGRRVKVVGNWAGQNGWSMASTSINYRIQGTGADQKYLAMMMVRDYVHDIGGYFGWDLHDGLYFYIPDAMVRKAVVEIKDTLDNLPYAQTWGFIPSIPLPFDVKIGKSWGTLREQNVDEWR